MTRDAHVTYTVTIHHIIYKYYQIIIKFIKKKVFIQYINRSIVTKVDSTDLCY